MSKKFEGKERRDHPRVSLSSELRGKIQTVAAGPVVDVSLSGALLEVPCTLPANARYVLNLPTKNAAPLELKAEVVRSYVHGFDKNDNGQTTIKYRAAIRFCELTEEQTAQLEKLVSGQAGSASA